MVMLVVMVMEANEIDTQSRLKAVTGFSAASRRMSLVYAHSMAS